MQFCNIKETISMIYLYEHCPIDAKVKKDNVGHYQMVLLFTHNMILVIVSSFLERFN